MTNKVKFVYILIFTFLGACAHHRDVRPGVKGVHRVRVQAESVDQGSRSAVAQANHFCEQRGLQAAFINEDSKYTGDMDEDTYKTTKRVGKVAQYLGGTVWVLGKGRGTRDAGGLVGLGGSAAQIAAGKGYTVEMKFKCL